MSKGLTPRPVLESLPEDYLVLIGKVAFAWALLENALRKTIFMMLDLSDSRGRTAVRTPRAKEMVEMIHELAITESFTINLSGLDAIEEIERRRNLVVHGIWYTDDDGRLLLQDLTGRWPKTSTAPAIKRRVLPAAVPIGPDNLDDLAGSIEALTQNVYLVRNVLHSKRSALRRTHPAPVPEASSPDRDQIAIPKPRRSPSGG